MSKIYRNKQQTCKCSREKDGRNDDLRGSEVRSAGVFRFVGVSTTHHEVLNYKIHDDKRLIVREDADAVSVKPRINARDSCEDNVTYPTTSIACSQSPVSLASQALRRD
jgi:hypothetical protein